MTDHDTGGKKKKQLDDIFSSFFAKFAAEDPFIHKRKALRSEVFVTPKRVEKNDKIEKLWSEFSKLEGANKFEEIITCMNSIIELDPGNASAWLNKAGALHNLSEQAPEYQTHLDKLKEAKKCCLQALELKPDWWNAVNNLGTICESLDELEDAKKYYDKATKLDPTSSFSWINKGNVLSKSSNIEENKEALDCYDKAIKLAPTRNLTTFSALAGKGALLAINFEKYEEALKCFDDAIIAVTEEMLAIFETRKTEKYENPAILMQVYANLAINKGAALLALKKYEIAINWFERQTKLIPPWPYPYERLAHTLTLAGKDEEALEYFDDAIKFSRQQPKEGGGRGAEGPPAEPDSVPKHAFHFVLVYEPIHIDEILVQKANALLRLKKPTDAIVCFMEALELNQHLPDRLDSSQTIKLIDACFHSILDLIFDDDVDVEDIPLVAGSSTLESAIKRLDSGAIEKLMNIIDMLQTTIKKAQQLDVDVTYFIDILGEILKSLKKNHPEIP